VLGGKLGVFDGDKVIAELRTGDMFGEMALVNKEPRSATVRAVNDSRLFVLTETTFERLMSKRVAIRVLFNIIKTLSHRLKEANKRSIS
jgi:CRP-like cAMP-binding protein